MSDENADRGDGRNRAERTRDDGQNRHGDGRSDGRNRAEPDRDDGRESLGYDGPSSDQPTRGDAARDDDDHDTDEKLVDTEPEAEAIDEPTVDSEHASRESRWGIQQGLAIGIVSIAVGLLVAVGLMQATGLLTLPGPFEGSAIANWAVFVALAVLLVAAFAYSQRGT
ncbi:hypothetical protein [Halovivax limisalsi]|uniref:hypothetical protein n=1 Tax=Halovivax limisalsi TaxID=1453760 RepID=UPI001FFDBA80|nr:hypothetical protein [Halovivax limisalsi]